MKNKNKTIPFILLLVLILFISNGVLYLYLFYDKKTVESYTSYRTFTDISNSTVDISFQTIVTNTYNDPSYQDILNASNIEIYDITRPYIPPKYTDPRTNYKTDNYDVMYHETYDLSDNTLAGTDIFNIGYTPTGSFRYGSRTFVPNYEDATLLSYVSKVYQGENTPSQLTAEYTLPIP